MKPTTLLSQILLAFALVAGLPPAVLAHKSHQHHQSEADLKKKGIKPLSNAQLKERYAKKKVGQWKHHSGSTGVTTITPDGKTVAKTKTWNGTGTWRIHKNTFCNTYPKVRKGKESCFRLYDLKDGTTAFYQTSGKFSVSGTYR